MMDCIMRFSRKIKLAIILLVSAGLNTSVIAENKILVSLLDIHQVKNIAYVSFNQRIDLTPELFGALEKGIPLQFNVNFQIIEHNKFWLDQIVLMKKGTYQIKYKNLIQQYEAININGEKKYFSEIKDGINFIENVKEWNVGIAVEPIGNLVMSLKVKLDKSSLPKPIQLNIGDDIWKLQSDSIVNIIETGN